MGLHGDGTRTRMHPVRARLPSLMPCMAHCVGLAPLLVHLHACTGRGWQYMQYVSSAQRSSQPLQQQRRLYRLVDAAAGGCSGQRIDAYSPCMQLQWHIL